jgi:archaellin
MPHLIGSAFDDIIAFHDYSPEQKLRALESLGELTGMATVRSVRTDLGLYGRAPRPYEYGAHTFGYIRPPKLDEDTVEIVHAGSIEPEVGLRKTRLWIGLGGMRVAEYPGPGNRTILFDFYGRNQTAKSSEHLHFNAKYQVTGNDSAGVLNLPIFVGLNAGGAGVSFECLTVNVANHDDQAFLSFLEGDAFKLGLRLVTTAQPALAVFSEMALSITKSVAKRHQNVPVQKFALGLDFSDKMAAGARLRQGTYIAVQIPQQDTRMWSWDAWRWSRREGLVVDAVHGTKLIPYNAIMINVRASDE